MISRRLFVKQMLAFFALAAGSAASAVRVFGPGSEKNSAELAEAASPAAADPAGPAVPIASFFLLSDIHLSAVDPSMADKLHLALQDISKFESKVDTVILGGDLTDFGRTIEYDQLRKILGSYKLPPVYGNMGNHDYYDIWLTSAGAFSTETMPNGKTDAMARERFQQFFGQPKPYRDVWIGGTHLILLSQDTYVQERPEVGEGAWYSDEQLAWFEEVMKVHNYSQPAFVFIHQPLPDPGTDGGTHRLIRAKRFREILAPYPNVFVFSGHSHRNFIGENHYNQQNTFHWFNNASVGKTRAKPGGAAGTQVQGMHVQVFSDRVVVRGREFTDRTWIDGASWTVPLTKPGHT
ncbi:metallophosphoesterase family protein [Paenibacillus caseinilyticus]|uniref:Phosphohydrolase n=1 Tax=Paenibacillus mucilaginosus K02 TaxID=997761 RepID=I0BRF5_9BACL|nr:metallophosphoesterase [Paenibacillus mucilaginosus]AFH64952.1 phosphohydrolase [Paenibacillus mucilaginosus K02]AFK65373.1 phosphohydrolase [Paenibacillus mucilaginosus K02]AFK65380.1 tat pathway signal sequence domain protein [Paenibacillus mucilaginosus K02]